MKFINDTSETIIFANEVDFATLVEVNDATVVYKISFEIDLYVPAVTPEVGCT